MLYLPGNRISQWSPMKTNPSTGDLLMQPWSHTKVFKGAVCWGKAGSFSQTPPSSTSSDPCDWMVAFASLLPYIIPEPLAAGLCFQPPVGTEFHSCRCHCHIRLLSASLPGGCDGSCLTAAIWEQNSESQRAPWAWGRTRREMSTLHGLNPYKLAS